MSEDGKAKIDSEIVLDAREKTFAVDTTKPFKLNANTVGVCEYNTYPIRQRFFADRVCVDRVLYTPERLATIAQDAAKADSVYSVEDRIGLVHDAMALSKSGFAELSSALTLVKILRDEKECQYKSRAVQYRSILT